ncbi:Glutamyl-tRNA(Gln) synthetase, partial [hydrothermal vent metagenome]
MCAACNLPDFDLLMPMNERTVKTRFAPSPTGEIHLGNLRTALFNALYARREQGIFLLRIENTDAVRSKPEFEQALMRDLRWLSLNWQEGPEVGGEHAPYHQSARLETYSHYYQTLAAVDACYPCFCSETQLKLARKAQRTAGQPPKYLGTCAHLSTAEIEKKLAEGGKPTLRFRVPPGQRVEFEDFVRGVQRFASSDIGDFIIRRSDGTPAFFFTNAIDDALMGVSHVLRGEDHLTNTPRQLMLLAALSLPAPAYGHLSLLVGSDGSPLSKRHGSRSMRQLREAGYLPGAILNYLARLGHKYAADHYLDVSELAAAFDLARLSKAPARFDETQLRYWQKEAVLSASSAELVD